MAMKPRRSSKFEVLIGLEDLGGSKNSPLGVENWLIEIESMEKDKRREKVKEKIHGNTRFEDNYNNRFPATVPEMLVGIS
jgi:hypothetical protein